MSTIPNIREQQALLREAFIRLVDEVKQKAIVDAGLNQTVASGIYHGRKGIGDETIEKLDLKFPEWRTINDEKPSNAKIDKKLNLDFVGIVEFKNQLNYFFDGMSTEHKEALVQMANKLHEIDNDDPKSAPFKNIDRRNKEKESQ